jgi:uncharacterized protein
VRSVAILPIRLYQLLVSPLLPANTCKYHPSCSQYAILAIRKHGVLRGVPMAAWRLLRCNPWSHGGVDYPPGVGSAEPGKAEAPASPAPEQKC